MSRHPGLPCLTWFLGAACFPITGCAVHTDQRVTDHDTYLLGPNMSYNADTGQAAFGNSAAVHEDTETDEE